MTRRLLLALIVLTSFLRGEMNALAEPRLVVADALGAEDLISELLLALRIAIPELRVERDDGAEALARVAITPGPHEVLVEIAVPGSRLSVERRVVVGDAAPPEIAEALALVVRSLLSLALLDAPEQTQASPALVHIAQPRAEGVARRLAHRTRPRRRSWLIPLRLGAGATVVFGQLPLKDPRFGARVAFGARAWIARIPVDGSLELALLAPLVVDGGRDVRVEYRGFPVSFWAGLPFLVRSSALGPLEVTPGVGFLVENSLVRGLVASRPEPLSFSDWNAAMGLRGRIRCRIVGRLWADVGLQVALALGGQTYRQRRTTVLETPGLALATDIGLSADLP